MINEASIKCFMALCETLSFTEAARQLFMTQQSVSKYIAKLEEAGCTVNEFDEDSVEKLNEIFQAYWMEQIEPLGDEAVAQLNKIIELTA